MQCKNILHNLYIIFYVTIKSFYLNKYKCFINGEIYFSGFRKNTHIHINKFKR